PSATGPTASPLQVIRRALRAPAIRRMLLVYTTAGAAYASVLVYQVPILNAGGLALASAGAVGGLRGFCQIFGRIGLTGLTERFGAGQLLRLAYIASAIGVAFLFVVTVPTGIAYAVIAGIALGANSPLQAIYARNHFNPTDLGLLMGLQGAAVGIGSGLGPSIGGSLRHLTGTWIPTILMAVAALVLAATVIQPTTHKD
ncbi:MAG: MFS transporter, partial [Acidimicrobiales bacterium]